MELPRLQFLALELRHLRFPLWNPNLWCGQPFLAQFTGAAYPLNWILALRFVSGKISFGSLIPTGSVGISLNSVTQNAAIQAGGNFSSGFATGSLAARFFTLLVDANGEADERRAADSDSPEYGKRSGDF